MSAPSQDPEHPANESLVRDRASIRNFTSDEWVLDSNGWLLWYKSPQGEITFYERDAATGLVMRQISDVNLFLYNIETLTAGHGAPVPQSWKTPPGGGSHQISAYEYDDLRRTTRHVSCYHLGEARGGSHRISVYEYDDLHRVTNTTITEYYPDEKPNSV